MGVPSKPLPRLGGFSPVEDPKILDVLQELQAILSGGVDDGNVATLSEESLLSSVLNGLGISGGGTTRRGYAEVLTEESTTSTSIIDLATAGPTVTVTVPTGGLVTVLAEVELKNTNGVVSSVTLAEDGVSLGTVLSSSLTTYEVRRSSPASTQGTATRRGSAASLLTTPGVHAYKLRYLSNTGGPAFFKNRKLWVVTTGP